MLLRNLFEIGWYREMVNKWVMTAKVGLPATAKICFDAPVPIAKDG